MKVVQYLSGKVNYFTLVYSEPQGKHTRAVCRGVRDPRKQEHVLNHRQFLTLGTHSVLSSKCALLV